MRKQTFLVSLAAVVTLILSSCSSNKDFVYLQDMKPGLSYEADQKYEAVIHRDDRLDITVSCKNPELALPFNMQGGSFNVASDGTISETTGGNASTKGYRVDVDGYIDFPILGKLRVEGMTVGQVTDMIKRQIIQGNYIKEPIVQLEFLNFKYTVLGAVSNPGTYSVVGDRVTLIDAIAKAGDLDAKARVEKVSVIREENGNRRMYTHDLRERAIFDSPAYYLQQNDIVYVEPKYRKKDTESRVWQYATFAVSLGTLAASLIWATK